MPILTCPVPSTISTLNPNAFQFGIQKYPELDYFVQQANLPGMTLGTAMQASSVHDIKHPGETAEFDNLDIQFLVDEKMANYLAIYDWIVGLGFPTGHPAFTSMVNSARNQQSYSLDSKTTSDANLMILDANNKPLKRFTFVDAFPVSLSALTFQANNSDVNYLVASLTMAYSYYTVT